MKKTKLFALIVALVIALFAFTTVVSAETQDGWDLTSDGWTYYQYGEMLTDTESYIEGNYYRFDENGIMYSNRWYEDAWGDWYYYNQDGTRVEENFKNINGAWYYFGWNGCMYSDTNFGLYDYNLNQTIYYRAKADGALYTSEWYEDEYGNWYYYDENCQSKEGFKYIGGKWYYFDYNCYMLADQTFDLYDGNLERWIYYRAKADGSLYTNEWYLDEYGDWYYYDANCQAPRDSAYVGGAWYYFFYDGMMAEADMEFNQYDYSLDRWISYRTKSDATLYVNEWYLDEDDEWYYYGEGGKSAYGFVSFGNVSYYFYNDGKMATNTSIENNGRFFIVNEDGIATECANNGWTTLDGDWYYVQDGAFCRSGVYLIAGSYYGFDWDGKMYDDTRFEIYYYDESTETGDWYYYCALPGGKLAANQWIKDGSNWYYYGPDCIGPTGPAYVSGLLYYFYDGRMQTNDYFVYGDRYIIAGENGVCGEGTNNSWINVGEDWYYVLNGNFCSNGIYFLGENGWAFDYDGKLYKEPGISYYDGYAYLVGADGMVVSTPGWHTIYGNYVYVTDSWMLAEGWVSLYGKWYYFDYENYMYHSSLMIDYTDDGAYLYSFDQNGISTAITTDGWYELNTITVYVRDGKVVTSDWINYNGSYYYFDYDGWMLENTTVYDNGYYYYLDGNGRMFNNGWVRNSYGRWYYANPDGTLTTGIDAQGYVFNYSGALVVDSVAVVDGTFYVTDINGQWVAALSDGWNNINNTWYYVFNDNGHRYLASGVEYIDGYVYCFENNKMITNRKYGNHYFGADGYAVSGWINLDGYWYYASENSDYPSFVYNGIYTIGGTKYFFSNYILQANKTLIYEGDLISTDANGVVVSETDAEGWVYNNNNGYGAVYYYENGKAYTGWKGNYYINSGLMYANQTVHEFSDTFYYVDKNGLCVYNGWINIGTDDEPTWLCAKADGTLYFDEWLNLNGIWYYFNGYHMTNDGVYEIDGAYHIFNEDGVWQGQLPTNSTDGWVYENGNYYYYMAGERIGGTIYSDGAWYYVNIVDGMAKNEMRGSYYYGADGIRANYVGWVIIDGNWCYFDENHCFVSGWILDGGKYYYQTRIYDEETEEYSYGIVTGYYSANGQMHYFDANGAYCYTVTTDGWIQAGEDWYYVQNGKLVTSRDMYWIGGAYYAFASNGAMVCNGTYNNRFYGSDGRMITGTTWYLADGEWVYVIDGFVARGIHLIDGVQYYFESYDYYDEYI